MYFGGAFLKNIRACPLSKATGLGLVHEKCFSLRKQDKVIVTTHSLLKSHVASINLKSHVAIVYLQVTCCHRLPSSHLLPLLYLQVTCCHRLPSSHILPSLTLSHMLPLFTFKSHVAIA